MQRFGLGLELLDRRPNEVSVGELQRFAILRTRFLMPDPACLLRALR